MATSSVQPAQPISETQLAANRTQALSLVWGGFMLAILSVWLRTQHEDLPLPLLFLMGFLAALSFGCGIWQFLSLGRAAAATEQKHAHLHKQRKVLGLVMLVGGLLLIGSAIFLEWTFGLAAFGEAVGMILLGLGALVGSCQAIRDKSAAVELPAFFERLRRNNSLVGMALLVVGVVLGLTGLVFALLARFGQTDFPDLSATLRNEVSEIVCLFLLGILGLVGGVWLTNSKIEELTAAKMRLFVLVVGGCFGLVLAGGALVRAILWSSDVFGGMGAWQGNRAWHLWLCAYVELIGLVIMFASLLAARADIRSSVVLRRALFGYNAVLTGLLLLATLVVLNIVVYAIFPNSF